MNVKHLFTHPVLIIFELLVLLGALGTILSFRKGEAADGLGAILFTLAALIALLYFLRLPTNPSPQ